MTDQQDRFDLVPVLDTDTVVVALAVGLSKSWLELAPDQDAGINNSKMVKKGFGNHLLDFVQLPENNRQVYRSIYVSRLNQKICVKTKN